MSQGALPSKGALSVQSGWVHPQQLCLAEEKEEVSQVLAVLWARVPAANVG